ncbi:pyridoxal-dependent decarboxylase, exosortase A system-associated [Massilia eurypsychrophila]|uniref:Pyridoxal-dependent decarboxylase, exosortase A system-associated n=1 Tax=Massilia eurypsychrophila TaxID=1485217 RepID=A0A2G8TLR1_9BURK|nr:pyridoxal-dependent decarboxylase, exosortase A system-associated [Massilia eurypsychrophila]PIL46972.1 pyridoxal-dependent decarboxylase, exosortase A system-associated [Massilia eurypsychrophila]
MNAPRPKHAELTQFAVVDDVLQVGGIALTRLAERIGHTPFYAYDRASLTARVALLREHLPPEIHLHYAMKANPMPAVVQHMASLVDGIDIASGGELRVALDTPMDPGLISFAGPGKSDADLSCAVAAGVVLNMESEAEMERLALVGKRLGITPKVAIRVNPDFELKSSGMKMGGGPKQFGVDAERVPEMLARLGQLELAFQGFHIYSGSQNLKAASLQDAHEKTFALAIRLAQHAPSPVLTLNIGGGFGIPYFPGEERLDLAAVGVNLKRLLPDVQRALPGARIDIELGRYLVAEAGVYVSRVIERKVSRGQVYLVTDGGLHHHLAASGNFGQVIRKNYPVVVGNRVRGGERETASVVGPLCTPLDLLADQMDLARADVGDLVVVLQSGAYGLSASPGGFLSHPAALEALV